jgi:hypothetical protein
MIRTYVPKDVQNSIRSIWNDLQYLNVFELVSIMVQEPIAKIENNKVLQIFECLLAVDLGLSLLWSISNESCLLTSFIFLEFLVVVFK